MPLYIYRCKNKHENTLIHGMNEIVKPFCSVCGEPMWKKPQALAIKRSCFIEQSPAIRDHLAHLSEKRDQYEAQHEDS